MGYRQFLSNRRLDRAFAERDAEIAARLGEDKVGGYRFQCRFCGSRFSLAQQLEAHEAACATPEEIAAVAAAEKGPEEMSEAAAPVKLLHCRRCGEGFPTLKDLSRHAREAHTAEHHAQVSASLKRYHQDLKKLDAAACLDRPGAVSARTVHAAGPAPANLSVVRGTPPSAPSPARALDAVCCPTCGGPLPAVTAALVAELRAEGLGELEAFTAARVARRLLAGAAA